MMAPEPLRSAMTTSSAEDTSLALPSDDKLRTGQRRVLDQVHTIKRSKSKPGKSESLSPSPSSPMPPPLTCVDFGSFKFAPTKVNGNYSRTSSAMSSGFTKMNTQKTRTLSTRTVGQFSSSATWDQQNQVSSWPKSPNGLKPSRSDPALAPAFSPLPAPVMKSKGTTYQSVSQNTLQTRANRNSTYSMGNGSQMTSSQTRIIQSPTGQSPTEKMGTIKISTKALQQSAVNTGINMSDVTLKEAVEYLSHTDENYQQFGATFIQHTTFNEERAKQEVSQLEGIPALVSLLRSPSPAVNQAAAGALRNLVFKHESNKMEVQHCGGIAKALQLLKETDSTETQKQITGLLWNLSSSDELKQELTVTALPALTENVVMPFTCWSDSSTHNNIHPDVFYNATGCLRNLSCSKQNERQAMRECSGLIDSLMSYVQSCVAEDNPDDKSVENSACILHNLTYQLESEVPECFSSYYPPNQGEQEGRKSPTVGCFSQKGSKMQKQFVLNKSQPLLEDGNPSGQKWLCHPKAMQTYLSLLGSSQKDSTLEACCGALQNLTASKGPGSSIMSQILVQKLGALLHLPLMLRSPNPSLQKTAMSLLNNMSRAGGVQTSMAKQILPELTSLLSSGPREMGKSDDTIATACNTVRTLMLADSEVSKKAISNELVTSLADLSENGSFPKGSKAAALLLYNIWNEKNLQGAVKKLGLAKSLFVNDNTTALYKTLQIVE